MLKSFVTFEEKVLGNIPGYTSMGLWIYYIAAIAGAVLGLSGIYVSASGANSNIYAMLIVFAGISMSLFSVAIVDSMFRLEQPSDVAKKSLLNCALIFAAMLVGCILSIVVVIILMLLFVLYLLGSSSKKSVSRGRKDSEDSDSIRGSDGNNYWISSKNADGSVTTTDGKRMRKMPDNNWQEF